MTLDGNPRSYRLGVLAGDGIGPEVVAAAVAVVDAAWPAAVDWVPLPMGLAALASHGDALPPETLDGLAALDGWVMGPHDSAAYPESVRHRLNPSGLVRKHFDLYANLRPARSLPGAPAICTNADLLIVRENTQGFYADRNAFAGTAEYMPTPDVAIASGIFTRAGIERIARVGFEQARRRRQRLTIVHKANVLRLSFGMFLQVCEEVGRDFPDVTVDDAHIDAMTVRLVRHAADLDVVLTENMFGDILSDLAGEVSGSLGIAASINASDSLAMAQAAHGSAPDIAGRDVANPIGLITSAAMLLRWLGERHDDQAPVAAADRIDAAVAATVAAGVSTPDLGGTAGTQSFTRAVVEAVVDGLAG